MTLNHAWLITVVSYDPETGFFHWKNHPTKAAFNGRRAGSLTTHGYWRVRIRDVEYLGHILAWFWMIGSWPDKQIDHKDRVRHNLVWDNLRLATHSEQQRNRVIKLPKSGFRGVMTQKNSPKFSVQVRVEGKCKYLGSFLDARKAAGVYDAFVVLTFGSDFPTNKSLGLL